jgi:integrase
MKSSRKFLCSSHTLISLLLRGGRNYEQWWIASDPALTGLRAGEILGLRSEDVDLHKKTLGVRLTAWYGKIQSAKIETR